MQFWEMLRAPSFRFLAAVLAVLVCAGPVPARAQTPTLAELAKKEEDRRKAIKAPAKVISDKDLPKRVAPPPGVVPAAPPAAAEQKPPAAAQPEEEKKDEAWWRSRMMVVREELRRNQMFAEALQSRINALSADFVNRDDPFQRAKIGEDRQKALAELDRVKQDIEKSSKAIADIEDEARQAGVPPGWIR